ncbi:hypothetical protein JCM14076_16290 [Methylosoma difficile]
MEIINSIAHKIIKHKREKDKSNVEAEVQLRDDIFDPANEKVVTLIEALLKIYKGKTFGSFETDTKNHPFQLWAKNLYAEDYSKQVFIELTVSTVSRIKYFIEKENFATGGFLVFVHYRDNNQTYLMIAMIKDKGGLTFTPNMELTDVQHIDLEKLHQASRIDLNRFEHDKDSYLSFLKDAKPKGDKEREVTGYFTDALGCTGLISSNHATKAVLNLIDEIFIEAKLDPKPIHDEIYDFLQERHKIGVKIEEIAAKINYYLPIESHDAFIEKANSDKFRISQEFFPSLTILNNFKRVYHKSPTWNLSFDKNALGTPESQAEIIFNAKENSLTINSLPQKFIDELIELTIPTTNTNG